MKRLVKAAVSAVVLALIFGTAISARGGATIDTFPVSFVLTSATCSNLPAGTVITASGTEKSITTVTNRGGVETIENSSHANGTAVDQNGRAYVFNYSNEFRGSFEGNGIFTATMNDSFTLAGQGPAHLSNGFTGTIVTDFFSFFTVPHVVRSHGDPLDFVTGDVHCDPL